MADAGPCRLPFCARRSVVVDPTLSLLSEARRGLPADRAPRQLSKLQAPWSWPAFQATSPGPLLLDLRQVNDYPRGLSAHFRDYGRRAHAPIDALKAAGAGGVTPGSAAAGPSTPHLGRAAGAWLGFGRRFLLFSPCGTFSGPILGRGSDRPGLIANSRPGCWRAVNPTISLLVGCGSCQPTIALHWRFATTMPR